MIFAVDDRQLLATLLITEVRGIERERFDLVRVVLKLQSTLDLSYFICYKQEPCETRKDQLLIFIFYIKLYFMVINAETLIGVTKSDSCELGPRFLPKAFDS